MKVKDHILSTMAALIAGKSTADMPLFSAVDHVGVAYTRNTGCFLARGGLVDLTCIPMWNSAGGEQFCGVAISPRHLLLPAHVFGTADSSRSFQFVTNGNVVVAATTDTFHQLGDGDLVVAHLTADLPGTITPCRVLPVNWEDYIAQQGYDLPAVGIVRDFGDYTVQGKSASIFVTPSMKTSINPAQVQAWSPSYINATAWEPFFQSVRNGDSGHPLFLIINNQLVLLTIWYSIGAGYVMADYHAAANTAMAGSGYTLTDADFSGFEEATMATERLVGDSNGEGTWTCPLHVTSVVVACTGDGGGGGSSASGEGGGGGGAFAQSTLTVSPGSIYDFFIGRGGSGAGEGTTFDVNAVSGTYVLADYGVNATGRVGGTGGVDSNCFGDVTRSGGAGGTSSGGNQGGGGGGGAAGSSAVGGAGAVGGATAGGAGGTAGGGDAGAGGVGGTLTTHANGFIGASYGGGGGGGAVGGSRGNGAPGTILLTYTIPLPGAPTNLTAEFVNGDMQLIWEDNADNETGFVIDRRVDGGGWVVAYATANVDDTFFVDAVDTGHTYDYQVRATNSSGDSANSNIATALTGDPPPPPSVPVNFEVAPSSSSVIGLSWEYTGDNAETTDFIIERSSNGTTGWGEISNSQPGAGITTVADTSLTAATRYYYRMRASNAGGESDNTDVVSASTLVASTPKRAFGGGSGKTPNGYDIGEPFTYGS